MDVELLKCRSQFSLFLIEPISGEGDSKLFNLQSVLSECISYVYLHFLICVQSQIKTF